MENERYYIILTLVVLRYISAFDFSSSITICYKSYDYRFLLSEIEANVFNDDCRLASPIVWRFERSRHSTLTTRRR